MKTMYTRLKRKERAMAYLSVIPIILIILAIRGYPMFIAISQSFTNWDGMFKNTFIGLANYRNIVASGEFFTMLRNSAALLLFLPFQLFFGYAVALLLYEEVFGWRFFRALYYLPQMLSQVIVGFLFMIFFGSNGPLNQLLRAIGLDFMALNWMSKTPTALGVIILCLVWANIGWQGILVLGGLSAAPPSIFEAARIDGANYWQRLFMVVLPQLNRVTEYSCIMSVMWVFTGMFPIIHSMTRGGPGYETTTIDYMIYMKAFITGSQLGAACAVAVILMLIVLGLTVIQMAIANRIDDGGE